MKLTIMILAIIVGLSEAPAGSISTPPAVEGPKPRGEQISRLPELKNFVEARYPAEAREKNLEGNVTLSIDIDEKGAAIEVRVIQGAGYGFDEAALEAARQFIFNPAQAADKPVPVRITYVYHFILPGKGAKPATGTGPEASEGDDLQKVEGLEASTSPVLPITFSGRVLERGTRRPLAGAEVVITDPEVMQITGPDGGFAFRGLPAGDYKVIIGLMDYITAALKIFIHKGERTESVIYLERLSYSSLEVTVRASRPKTVVTRHVLDIQEIKKLPGTQGDTLKVVEVLPGVARTPMGLGGMLVFRGADPLDSKVFVDGLVSHELFHFGGLRSIINSDLIEDLAYYPGNFGAYYGDAAGGVVDVKTRTPKDDRWHEKLDVNIFEGGGLVEGPITKKFSVAAAFHRNWHDVVLKAVMPKDVMTFTVAPRYYDYQFKLFWNPDPNHSLETFIYGTDDKMEFLVGKEKASGFGFNYGDSFHQLSLKYKWRVNENVTNTFQPLVGLLRQKTLVLDQFINLDSFFAGGRVNSQVKFGPRYEAVFGADLLDDRLTGNINVGQSPRLGEENSPLMEGAESRRLKTTANFLNTGIYAELNAEPWPDLKIIPGIRGEYFYNIDKFGPDARLAVRYKLFDRSVIKGGVGTYHQMPPYEFTVKGYGNPNLDPEWSIQYSAGWEQRLSELVSIDTALFYVDRRDLAVTNPDFALNPSLPVYINAGKGRSYGAEFILKHDPSKYISGWISYTLMKSERRFPGQPWQLFTYDQTHNLAAVGMVKLPRNWQISFRFRLVSGNPYDRITERGGLDADNELYIYRPTAMKQSRLPLTHSLDFRMDKSFIYNWVIWSVYLDVMNIYNHRNVEFPTYSYDYGEHDYFRGLPIIPALGTTLEF
ncbi:MAG: TonB-dependent receptor [bacterium]|nr:TonB-dependent receptor [bacterium]